MKIIFLFCLTTRPFLDCSRVIDTVMILELRQVEVLIFQKIRLRNIKLAGWSKTSSTLLIS